MTTLAALKELSELGFQSTLSLSLSERWSCSVHSSIC